MTCIDVHTHILPEHWPSWTERSGYAGWIQLAHNPATSGCPRCARMQQTLASSDGRPSGAVREFRTVQANCWDSALRIAQMRAMDVSAQVLSTVPVMFSYWARPADALDLSRLLNDHIAEICRAHSTHFAGLGTVPLQDPDLAIQELERCVLQLGLAGVQIGTNVNGVAIHEPQFRGFFRRAEQLGACVFVHPWEMMAGCEASTVPPSQSTWPRPAYIGPRLRPFWNAWLVGMPAETCLALVGVLMSGMLTELPQLRIGFAHGGGSFAGTIGRIEHGFHARPDLCQTHTTLSPRDHLRTPSFDLASPARPPTRTTRFFVDSLMHDEASLRLLIQLIGPERIMLGSDYPFPLGEERPGELIRSMNLEPSVKQHMLLDTARAFLGSAASRLATSS